MTPASSLRVTLPAELAAEPRAQEVLGRVLDQVGAPAHARAALSLIMEELFVNVARYAYPEGAGSVEVTVTADAADGRAEIVLADAGVPFDPFSRPEPASPRDAADLPVGGLGIVMVRRLATSCAYEREGGRNVVRVTRSWGPVEGVGPDGKPL